MSEPPIVPFAANGFSLAPGVRLLEASAGTGKTFALAHLVLRLVTRPEDPLRLDQLLVVTFTNAAAAELRDRIAARLQLALGLLEADPDSRDDHAQLQRDQPLREWLEQQPQANAALRGRLLLALEDLDQADITTIHGFCRRTLQRQSLEAGLGPAVELEQDATDTIIQICHDYWQQQVLPLAPELLAGLQQRGLQLERLQRLLLQLDGDPALSLDPLPPELSLDQPLAPQLQNLWPSLWQRFCLAWASRGEELEQALCQMAHELKHEGEKYAPFVLKPSGRDGQLSAWIAAQAGATPGYLEVLQLSNSAKSTPERLLVDVFHPGPVMKVAAPLEREGRGGVLPERPLLEAIAALVDGPAELTLLHFAHWSRQELARRRSRQGRLGFSQLLEELDPGPAPAACTDAHTTALIEAVAARYRVALIDEFQDTDPIQWRILERAFTAPAGEPARHLLVMVGDPKQAIYRFRGGELATYRQARARADAIHGLTQNRRASAALVAALNQLMVEPGLPRSNLPVPEVEACSSTGELTLPPGGAPLQLLPLDPEQLPQQVAALCLQLLQEHPLVPSDICLLVSRHSQAEALRHALESRHLPSRLVSKGDVFASEGATCLQRLLDALADPGNSNRQRLLAATPLLGWSAARIATTAAADWDELADRLCRLAAALQRQGLMAALGQLLEERQLAQLSLRGRALADLQQAAELVQEQMHRQALGVTAAADWLRRLRLDPDRHPPEAHQPRSDAAESAIAVVTVHRSKGLEYPVVICPYLWMAPQPSRAGTDRLGKRYGPPGAPRLDLHLNPHWGPGRTAAQQQQQAEEQEAERLAYVACTRACQLLVLGWHADEKHAANPLASWLLDGAGQPRELPLQWLEPSQLPGPRERWSPPSPSGLLQCGRRPLHPLDTSWGRSSYSAWAHGAAPQPSQADDGRDIDAQSQEGSGPEATSNGALTTAWGESQPLWASTGPLAGFPRGAGPGEALHRILERIDYQQPAHGPATATVVEQELERAGLDTSQQPPLLDGLEQLRLTPLGGPLGRFRLADLPGTERLNEMNFDLPLAAAAEPPDALVRASGLARVFQRHPGGLFGSRYAERLAQLQVASRGFLTGSIDLVFRCGERWWVADWKSNWLGERDEQGHPLACGPAHYGQTAMVELMAANHYPLQAHLYLVALHRYLRWRLPGYEPERHLGGYAYVFLRGAPGPIDLEEPQAPVPGMLVEQPPLQRLLALDALLREGQP